MSPAGAIPGREYDGAGFQDAVEESGIHSAVRGRTATPRQDTAQAASVMHPGQ